MNIKEKELLSNEYYKWIKEMKEKKNLIIKDNAMAVINFLDQMKVLKKDIPKNKKIFTNK